MDRDDIGKERDSHEAEVGNRRPSSQRTATVLAVNKFQYLVRW
jgi:hypothetical protein